MCLLNAKQELQVPEGGAKTKPHHLPVVHLEDGESRVLCQLLFLLFRRVGVLKEDREDGCVPVRSGHNVPGTTAATPRARGSTVNTRSVKKKCASGSLRRFCR